MEFVLEQKVSQPMTIARALTAQADTHVNQGLSANSSPPTACRVVPKVVKSMTTITPRKKYLPW
jgi:hypothetical protein